VPRSLAGRLTAAFVGVVLLPMLVLALVVPSLARGHQLAALENRLADEAQLIAHAVLDEQVADPHGDLDALAHQLAVGTEIRVTIIQPDGTVVGESHQDLAQVGNHASRREVQAALAGRRGVDIHRSETVGYEMLYVAVPIAREGRVIGVARAALPLSEVNRAVGDLTRAVLLAAVASGLLGLVVALLAARAIARPLGQLTRQAAALAEDPLTLRRARRRDGPTEVVQLGDTLDRLASAVQASLQRLAAERDRLDAVLGNLADAVVIVGSDGRVLQLNAAAERLLGLENGVASGRTAPEVLRDHEVVALVEQARTGAAPPAVNTVFLEWRQPRRFLRAAVSRFGVGEARQTLLLLQDLTELRRLETIRRDFVANVSHELRTPIAAIKAMTETLRDGALDDPGAARDFVARIDEEVDHVHQLVEELLELARLESGRASLVLAPVDPAELARVAVQRLAPLAERAHLTLAAEVPPGLPLVAADAERLGQVLVSVIHNAIKFTPTGGTIAVRGTAEDGRVELAVADTGEGIAPEQLPRIFERFFKADQARAGGGTGLGLAIAKHTIQLHGGEIWADSAGPGRGTTVYIRLPRAPSS
jgi:two-component system phosphate regulon sensor histidine kinase PhoR